MDELGLASSSGPAAVEVDVKWGLGIPLRDGVALNATLYRPRGARLPAPTLITMTPYIGQTYHDRGMYFAAHGYPFLAVDVRGRGNSEGDFDPNINEAKDGYDVVEWVAQQAYCNGRVAMWGGSYAGYVQWATAKEFPPHLATIVPVASPYIGVDFPIRKNISSPYMMQWLTLVWGRTSQDRLFWNNDAFWGDVFRRWRESGLAFRELDAQLGSPSRIFQEWLTHPQQDGYWDRYNPTRGDYARLDLPILSITGAYDGDQPGALAHYRNHLAASAEPGRVSHYLIIGPWDHAGTRTPVLSFAGITCGQESLVDLQKLHLEWYEWTMREGPKPQFLKKNVAYYVTGAEVWRYSDTLDGVTSHSRPLYLRSTTNPTDVFQSGMLSEHVAVECGPDHYTYDPRDVSLASLESTVDPWNVADQRMVHAMRGKLLVYHSEPFRAETEVSGFFRLTTWLSIDQPDTDFEAAVYEIDVGGGSILLSRDRIRARFREDLRAERLIRSTEPLRYEFRDFTFISRLIRSRSRLRLVLGPINSIYSQTNHNSGSAISDETVKDSRVVNVVLYHDSAHPSALYVPIGHSH